MPRGTPVPVTPVVLRWAIEDSGLSLEDIAIAVGVDPATITAWYRSDGAPTITQLRKLSARVRRPFAAFLLPEPPASADLQVEFRRRPGGMRGELNATERRTLRETHRQQEFLSWLVEELDEGQPTLPTIELSSTPEHAATRFRQLLRVSTEEQLNWQNASVALKAWRSRLEARGILVFLLQLGAESCRGFSLWDEHAPLVAASTWWNSHARIYTIFHELGHLLTRTSSACLDAGSFSRGPHADRVEKWCEEFAAAALLPWAAVEAFLSTEYGWDEDKKVEDLDIAGAVAEAFSVSIRAATLRLIKKGVADWSLYAAILPTADVKSPRRGGGGRRRGRIREDQFGARTMNLFARGIQRDVVDRSTAIDYLNVSIFDVEKFLHDNRAE